MFYFYKHEKMHGAYYTNVYVCVCVCVCVCVMPDRKAKDLTFWSSGRQTVTAPLVRWVI